MVDRIKRLCEENNTTIKSLEITLGFGNGTIRRWDKTEPSFSKIKQVADYFNVSYSYLISGKEDEKTASPTADGLSEYDIKALAWFHSLSPEKRKAILSLADGPEELAELPDCE